MDDTTETIEDGFDIEPVNDEAAVSLSLLVDGDVSYQESEPEPEPEPGPEPEPEPEPDEAFFADSDSWCGTVPDMHALITASHSPQTVSDAAFLLACRLHNLGYGPAPVRGSTAYPRDALTAWQADRKFPAAFGDYGPRAHRLLFGKGGA